MTEEDTRLLSNLWLRVVGTTMSPDALLKCVRSAGGYDMHRITDDDLIQLFQGTYSGDWQKPAFSFGELLAYYAAWYESHGKLSGEHFVAWAFTVFVIADAMSNGATEMEFQFNHVLNVFCPMRSQFELPEAVHLLTRFLTSEKND